MIIDESCINICTWSLRQSLRHYSMIINSNTVVLMVIQLYIISFNVVNKMLEISRISSPFSYKYFVINISTMLLPTLLSCKDCKRSYKVFKKVV